MSNTYSVDGKAQDAITWRVVIKEVDCEEDAAQYAELLSEKYPKNIYRLHEHPSRRIIATFINGKREPA